MKIVMLEPLGVKEEVVMAEANYEKASRPLGPKLSKVLA